MNDKINYCGACGNPFESWEKPTRFHKMIYGAGKYKTQYAQVDRFDLCSKCERKLEKWLIGKQMERKD